MEIISPYLGKFEEESIFLNNGKFGYYLNHNKKLYSVPQCFQKPTFKLKDAVKIIKYKQQKQEEEDKIKNSGKEPKVVSEDVDEIITKVKSKKKVLN